jgi:3',5'-cyclic-AMP phosphodiesterase
MLIAQVTDPHIKAVGQLAYRQVDTAANLARCIDHLLGLKQRPDLVLMTGDLTDFGREDEYRLLRELIAPLPMPVYVIPGNHDERENFRRAFDDHSYLPAAGKLHYVVDNYPIRMIGLDTTIAGKSGGEVDAACLAWLADRLAAAPEKPTLLFMHHPPINSGIEHMDVQNCANAAEFGNLLRKHPAGLPDCMRPCPPSRPYSLEWAERIHCAERLTLCRPGPRKGATQGLLPGTAQHPSPLLA